MRDISKETIEKAASGDMAAFEEIYKTFSSTVYTIAFNITRDHHDAEETTQDVFVKVFGKLKDFKFESAFGTWIYRVAVNTAINIYNGRLRRRQKTVNLDEAGDMIDASAEMPADALEREGAKTEVADMLKNLRPEHRSCIVLREIEGLDYREIAAVLRIPLNTVRSRLKRAREALMDHRKQISKGARYGL